MSPKVRVVELALNLKGLITNAFSIEILVFGGRKLTEFILLIPNTSMTQVEAIESQLMTLMAGTDIPPIKKAEFTSQKNYSI